MFFITVVWVLSSFIVLGIGYYLFLSIKKK